jgi:hypothetical protein
MATLLSSPNGDGMAFPPRELRKALVHAARAATR